MTVTSDRKVAHKEENVQGAATFEAFQPFALKFAINAELYKRFCSVIISPIGFE